MPETTQTSMTSLSQVSAGLLAIVATWATVKVAVRLWFSPLSKVPGPKFAAATYLHELWHAIVLDHWGSYVKSLHEKYGPIVRINPDEIHIVDNEWNHKFFNRRNLDKEERFFQFAPRSTATAVTHAEHKARRDIVSPLFNGKPLRQFESEQMGKYLQRLSQRVGGFAKTGEQVNLTHLLWALNNDILIKYIFGEETTYLNNSDLSKGYELRSFNALWIATIVRQWPLNLLAILRNNPKYQRFFPSLPLETLTEKMTAPLLKGDRDSGSKTIQNVASYLYNHEPLYRDPGILHPELFEFMLGGTEATTYNTLHVFRGIMGNPEIAAKLREELDSIHVEHEPIWQNPRLGSLKYLNAVVKEGFRLNDSDAIRFVRQSDVAVTYKDYVLPPGTTISTTEKFINWDPTLYPEPAEFRPERWLSEDEESAASRKYFVPFGVGNRTCVAKDFVLSMMLKTIAAIVIDYDVEYWDDSEVDGWGKGYLRLFPSASAVGPGVRIRTRSDR